MRQPSIPCYDSVDEELVVPTARSGAVPVYREPRSVVPPPRTRLPRKRIESFTGRVIAKRYRINSVIGAGGMGTVFAAIDLRTGAEVALKALGSVGSPDPIALKRLRREAETAISIQHNHVCHVHYLGVDHGTPFIVMERLHGTSLRDHLIAKGRLPIDVAVAIVSQLLEALAATHAAGVIHRDVKPGNVILLPSQRDDGLPNVKLIDFGLAKLFRPEDSDGNGPITGIDAVPGTLHRLAPEQLLGATDLDERVDVYAAGLVLFEMLAGERAFGGTCLQDVMHRIICEPHPPVSALRSDLPVGIDDVLTMALAKDRRRRFASATAFRRALESLFRDSRALIPSGSFRAPMPTMDAEDDNTTQRYAAARSPDHRPTDCR